MRNVLLALLRTLTGCIDGVLDDACDEYVDYLCDCGEPDCDQLRTQLDASDPSVVETCRLTLACFESADADATATCSLHDAGREDECDG